MVGFSARAVYIQGVVKIALNKPKCFKIWLSYIGEWLRCSEIVSGQVRSP